MGRRLGLVASAAEAGFALALVVGCADNDTATTLTVEGTVSVCTEAGSCTDLPAAGAAAVVYDGAGKQIRTGTLDTQGRLVVDVPDGIFSATLSMPGLGLHTAARSATVNVLDGGAGTISVALPALHVAEH
ncbi:hypothetical protein [Nocardioides sp. URHA0032]|uniref:hypothetical protein n=1 Tax=Nocardioides sp. URHA0032 TaxID=1380388 RepID=UPI000491FF2B|nr:hypothetical protein [Nocardioides sp. URHA0032]